MKRQGIMYILLSAAFFATMSFFVRLSGDVPVMQKCFFRNIVATVVAFLLLARSKNGFAIQKGSLGLLFLRAAFGTTGLICNFYAIDHMNISDANMLNKLSPFFAILFSGIVLKERASKFEWGMVIVAFCGALFVVKPSFSLACVPAIVGVMGGFGAGVAYTFVRKLGKRGERGPVIVMAFSLFSTLVTLPWILFDYSPMRWQQLACLLLAGCAATGGQLCITAAYTKAPAKEISVYDYTQIVFAAILGASFLGQVPDWMSIIGYVIIIGTGIVKWDYVRKQEAIE